VAERRHNDSNRSCRLHSIVTRAIIIRNRAVGEEESNGVEGKKGGWGSDTYRFE
jgi:hypothetical protein